MESVDLVFNICLKLTGARPRACALVNSMSSTHVSVMYNACYGGFSLSDAAMEEYRRQCPEAQRVWCPRSVPRHDPVLVGIVQKMGKKAYGHYAKIQMRKIPAQYANHYEIAEYDGLEHVVIKYDAYELDAIRSICKDRVLNKSDKLARIVAVLNSRNL